MSKIVSIMGGTSLHDGSEPNPEVIAGLEELLQMAKDGVIVGFTAMAERSDGIWRAYEAGPFGIEPMIGHLHRQINRLITTTETLDHGL